MTVTDDEPFLDRLRRRAAERPRTIVLPEGTDPRVLDAAVAIARGRLARPVLIGPHEALARGLEERSASGDVRVIDPRAGALASETLEYLRERRAGRDDPEGRLEAMAADPLMQAGGLVARGLADGVVAGCVRTTADVLRAALTTVGLADGFRTLSSSFYMVFDPDRFAHAPVLTFTDAGVVPDPNARQLADIAAAAVRARVRVVGDAPRVAFLSYSTKGSAEGPSVTRVREALALFRDRRPDIPADGELQGDAALSVRVAERKAPGSPVAGTANVLVFPDLDAANIAYKLVQQLAGAVALGPVLQGVARPFNDLSRGAVAEDIVAVSCITALSAD